MLPLLSRRVGSSRLTRSVDFSPRKKKRNAYGLTSVLRPACLAATIVIGLSSSPRLQAQQVQAAKKAGPPALAELTRGRDMFTRTWSADDKKTPAGDGLGPMYNARSCVECHAQGGVGGGGNQEHNVDLLSIIPPANISRIDPAQFTEQVKNFHPGFTAGGSSVRPSITLHKASTDADYDGFRTKVLAFVAAEPRTVWPAELETKATTGRKKRTPAPAAAVARNLPPPDHINFQLSQRSAPALFGAGLIDAIPDEVLRQTAALQAKRHTDVHGTVALAIGGTAGKFGWRGQTATLQQFVMGACANELGLSVPGNDQAVSPLDPAHKSPGLDLTQEQCNDLVAYVASLPRPVQRTPSGPVQKQLWTAGEFLFNRVGCAQCHMQKLGTVSGIYSDLLLHDMGVKLTDPSGANSPGSFSAAYYGGPADIFASVPPETRRQWRTPPLWGVADSGPYLHDGRAPTLEDAILEHDGEAAGSRASFIALSEGERAKLLAFLGSLAAPASAEQVAVVP